MKTTITLAPGAVIEPVGDDVMVMMPGNTDILRISGPAADTLRTIVAGQPVDPATPTVRELANQGIIQTSGMSRRGLIRAGAIGAGAGIAVLAMPTAAMASSPGPSPFVGTGTYAVVGNFTNFTIAKNDYPDVGTSDYGTLTIGDATHGGGGGDEFMVWQVSTAIPFTGDVVGTFSDFGKDPPVVYTVTFSPAPAVL